MVKKADVPVEWREHIHPRRGGIPGPRVVLDEDAARTAREWQRAATPIAQEMAAHENTDPELGKAVHAWLGGEPDPAGAAAVAAVAVKHGEDVGGAAFLDAWALDHGLAFAACAVIEASAVELGPVPRPAARSSDGVFVLVSHGYHGEPPAGWRGEIRRPASTDHFSGRRWVAEDAILKRLRVLLAAAPEAEYRDAVARMAAHRGDAWRRETVSYLVPTEEAWLEESHADGSGVLSGEHGLSTYSRPAHVERVQWTGTEPAVLGTLLDGLGSDALPLFGRAFGHSTAPDPNLLKGLLAIPDEGVFTILLNRMGDKGVPAALHEAAERYPAQALRALAPLAGESTTRGAQAAGVLRALLYADPGLAGEAPPGGVEALLPRPAVPDAGDLPAALAGRPARGATVDWADPTLLPRIRTRDGRRALPVSATRCLLNLLAKDAPEVAAVREYCDRHSLAEFSWALFQRWCALGAPNRHKWAMEQLGLIGDDTTVRRFSPLVKRWPGEGRSARAAAALDVLARIGSDVALTHLFELTRGGRYKSLKATAVRKIDEIAAARGITREALADRAVPGFGLDERGTLVLDYGPRRFTVTFDEQLTPLVVEPNGKIRKSVPKPGPKDDPALAPAAHALFTGLKKDLRTIADQEIKRLELAMTTRRTWTPDDFHTLFAAHPLLGHIARRLVWITDGGTAFRVAEDRTCADVNDDPFTPPPDARVGIAHPVLLDGELGAWSELFADYEILQPFEQLGRPVHRLTGEERTAHRLARVEGLEMPYGKAKGHSQGRWESVDAAGEFSGAWLARRDPAGVYVVANLSPGLSSYRYGDGDDQQITALWAGPAPAHTPRDSLPLGEVDPVTMSEAVHDLVRSAS